MFTKLIIKRNYCLPLMFALNYLRPHFLPLTFFFLSRLFFSFTLLRISVLISRIYSSLLYLFFFSPYLSIHVFLSRIFLSLLSPSLTFFSSISLRLSLRISPSLSDISLSPSHFISPSLRGTLSCLVSLCRSISHYHISLLFSFYLELSFSFSFYFMQISLFYLLFLLFM
jgi:hypothetical protein